MAVNSVNLETKRWLSVGRMWEKLTSPDEAIQERNRLKATILAAVLALFIPLGIITVFISPIIAAMQGEGFTPPAVSLLLAIAILIAAYSLSRTKYYEAGAYLTVFVPILAVMGVVFASSTAASDTALFYLALSIILSSLLLDARGTFITGALVAASLIAAHLHIPREEGFPTSILMFMIISTGIMASVSYIRDTYLNLLDTARSELEIQFKEAEAAKNRAERSDQVKSAFLASMSHELRTPLNSIINFSKFVVRGVMGPVTERQEETLNRVIASAQHLLALINDVLDMSKIESGSLNLFIENDINLNDILDNVTASAEGLLAEKQVKLEKNIAANLPLMRADRKRITQIVLNITSNACKFTDEGFIKISAASTGDEVTISIQDTGPGIAPEDYGAIFEPFQQTQSGLRQAEGTGLGMPITKSLVEAHNGQLWFESTPGKGSIFHVRLPIKTQVAEAASA